MALVGKTKSAALASPPPLWKLVGPSFILLGLGLGSGEIILWPYLAANYGLGLIWGALVGITLQFFLNMEIERYTLAKGESVFVGLARKLHLLSPVWFFISTLLPWLWPGIIATSGMILAHIFGLSDHVPITIGLLLAIGVLLSTGKTVYQQLETWQKLSISLGVPFILLLTLRLVQPQDWTALASGLLGSGSNYQWLPAGLPILTFLGALAYSGAGGNLNLAQSFYIKDKGYGMGRHAGQMTSLIRSKTGVVTLEGFSFPPSAVNLARFQRWWRLINLEHAIVFWFTGLVTMLSLATLSFAVLHGLGSAIPIGVGFLFAEAAQLGFLTVPLVGTLFLLVCAVMLFSTQTSIFDATSRILAENLAISHRGLLPVKNLGWYYYGFLWLQIAGSIMILRLGFTQPFELIVISALLNALSMAVYSLLLVWLNTSALEPALRPNLIRRGMLLLLSIFFAVLAGITLMQR